MAISFLRSYTPEIFLMGIPEDRVFVPPLPANFVELRTRIIPAVAEVTPETLRSVCGKKLSTSETSAALPVEVTSDHNYLKKISVCFATF
jgi:hypothetical protein